MMHEVLLAAVMAGSLMSAGVSTHPSRIDAVKASAAVPVHASMPHDRPIVKDVVVAAPVEDVWKAWTTAEGTKTFFAPGARVEAKVGGPYEILFMLNAPEGQQGSEGCSVLLVEPMTRFAFSWNAPPMFESIRNGSHKTRVDIRLEPVDAKHTKVILTHSNWPHGDDWEQLRAYFDKAWPAVLASLQKRFVDGPVDWTEMAGK